MTQLAHAQMAEGACLAMTPRHLVLLADGGPHDVADELRSHATVWNQHFTLPLLRAQSPAEMDARFGALRRPFARRLLEVAPITLGALADQAAWTRVQDGWATLMQAVHDEPAGGLLDAHQRQDLAWALDVTYFGMVAVFIEASDQVQQLLPLFAEWGGEADVPEDVLLGTDVQLLLAPTTLLMDAEPEVVPPPAVREALCAQLFGAAERLDDGLRRDGIDWRRWRDRDAGSRADRIAAYARGVTQGLPAEAVESMEREALRTRPLFGTGNP